ncbi:MAG TPA: hypothetical protein VKR06_07260 [Ktedonosporobacter sp.]|nr:hypothetical protein [Ktedonosporobacter sp.]
MTGNKADAIGGIGFDRLMVALGCWFIGGLYIDGWAHGHGFVDNTFFTPWHAILYSGYFANAAALIATTFINHRRGAGWLQAIPNGYELALFGAPLFTVAGVGDLIWHTLFGFEVGIAPLLSPPHLILAFSGLLMISGPFQAVWRRADRRTTQSWSTLLPGLISLFLILSILSFFTEFAQPFSLRYLAIKNYTNQNGSLGAAGIIIQAGLLMGTILLAARRWRLPGGTITLILGVNALLMAVLDDGYMLVPAAVVVGVVADLLYWKWQPSIRRLEAWRAFAFLVPLIYYLGYFLSLLLYYQSITWTLHLWLGSTIVASVAGLLLSYLLVPPQFPTEAEE